MESTKLSFNQSLRKKLYTIIFESDTPAGKAFDVILILCIILSIALAIVESMQGVSAELQFTFIILEYIFTGFFTFEYITRIYCSPKPKDYIFSFFGIVDLLATLPLYLAFFIPGARYLFVIRSFRIILVFRIFKLFNFCVEGELLLTAIKQSSKKIAVFFVFVIILVISIGTLMYMIEGSQNETAFNNIPNSIYWACVTMTTVGYGDITPATALGKFLSACVMVIGYTIIAVPTGIVSVSMIKEQKKFANFPCPNCNSKDHDVSALFCHHCGYPLDPDGKNKEAETVKST